MRIVTLLLLAFSLSFSLELRVGSENAYKPFAYLNEKGEPSGFDNDVMRAISTYVEDSKLEFSPLNWNALFSALDAKKIDIIANQITKTKEREEKYIFSKNPYFYDVSTLISLKNTPISDIKELKGAKIGVTIGSNHAKNLEEYLANHKDLEIQIVYYKTSSTLVADLKNKRIHAMVNNPIAAQDYAKAQKITITPAKFYFEKVPVYLIYRKDSAKLAKIIDKAMEKAVKNGKIATLQAQYFGEEYFQILKADSEL
ncbi:MULTISPECIES: substrate-binding periplasmic protein [Helicobacter]|uniref:Amino acid ABC transporter substrate-binding protein n=2 Tax=Helicobacter typhlonius TaxID=76936 RepID=A0A099UGB8_9HELI|nr:MULTISPECIES: transporter substrate-binding domain-containing protein [Helicobacter]TLD78911.1 amino acid ABC transporter substrate-binding protein [Helicobacter typhlonius]TLD90244.1 amino acid ABC transporter substrate-binding protein [Helicobacter sp. MIT 03-1616]CUU40926.1 Amino acid ABC transporter, periplasmic amino acid-binding portion [Helicobacter typhlonius]